MDLDHTLRPRGAMEAIDVLGDDRSYQASLLELGQDAVGAIGLLGAKLVKARPVVAPEARRVAMEGVDVGDLHRVDVLPHAGSGCAEVGNARRHRNAGTGQHDRRG